MKSLSETKNIPLHLQPEMGIVSWLFTTCFKKKRAILNL